MAQVPQPSVTLTLDGGALDLGAANTTTRAGNVSYAESAGAPDPTGGQASGAVTLTAVVPDGWTVVTDPPLDTPFQVGVGASVPVTITITAPAAGEGAQTGELALTANAAGAGGRSATATASIALARVDPLPPPPTPFYLTPLGLALEISIPLLLVAGVVATVLWRRKVAELARERAAAERAAYLARETGIVIAVEGGPQEYGHRREVMYRLTVQNRSDRSRVALIEVVSVTNGWRAATAFSRVALASGEKAPVTLVVTPDTVITPGDRATVVVRAKPEEAVELDERVTLDVVAPKSGSPTDEHYKIVTVHREGANKGIRR